MSWFSRLFKKERQQLPKPPESNAQFSAYVHLDFVKTFPHAIWVSTVTYDNYAPDGFCYKLFATRHEPEMLIQLLLLRQMMDGTKTEVLRADAPMDKFEAACDGLRILENSANVTFERFELSTIRTLEEFRSRAIDLGWEMGQKE